jgi:hypothetical protein
MYTYNGHNYKLLEDNIQIKNSTTREWEDAVYYQSLEDGKKYGKNRKEFFENYRFVEDNIPYHIQAIGKIFSLIRSKDNISKGEIRKFNFVESCRNQHGIGKRVLSMERIDNNDYDAIWVGLGNDYFKMIGLWA